MSKVKSIIFRTKLAGRGVVNYDDKSQGYLLRQLGLNHLISISNGTLNNNVKYAKKRFYTDENKNVKYKIVISPYCLGKAIYANEIDITTPMVGIKDELFIPYIASPSAILRGYMQTNGKNESSWVRKSPITLPEAIQSNDVISSLEINSKTGDRSDTSMFYNEVVGDIEYETLGAINLQELQFCSVDPIHGRAMFNEDYFETYKKTLAYQLPNFDTKLGYYCGKHSVVKIPERGFLLSNDNVNYLIRFYFERLLSARITRAKAFTNVAELEYKLVTNPLTDLATSESGWNKLESLEDIQNINFEMEDFYKEFDEAEGAKLSEELKNVLTDKKNNKAQAKAEEKARKDEAKKAKEAKEETSN